jgi:hypothetical protein
MFDSVYFNHTNHTPQDQLAQNGYDQPWLYAEYAQLGGTGTTNILGKGWLGTPLTAAYNINNTSESLITCLYNGTAISRFVFDNLVGSVQSGATGAGSTDPAVVACRGKQLQDVCSLNGKTGFCNPGSTDSVVVCIPNS